MRTTFFDGTQPPVRSSDREIVHASPAWCESYIIAWSGFEVPDMTDHESDNKRVTRKLVATED